MHPNPAFRHVPDAQNVAFACARGFGTLAVNGDPAPLLAHIPFLLSPDGTQAELHLVRSNPISRLEEAPAVLSVTGPDGYVSPDWYGVADQVPTWNYVVVQLSGMLTRLQAEALPDMLARLSQHFEDGLSGKRPWTKDKMSEGTAARMMRQIVPYRLDVSEIAGAWKLNQNKTDAARLQAADHVADPALAALMRRPPA